MEKIIGDKKSFAVQIHISRYEPWLWGKTCIWINNSQIGDFEDENILGPFIGSLMRVAIKSQGLWFKEFEGLDCREIFTTINPFYGDPDKFYDLPGDQQEKYTKYDIFLFQFGENFDNWLLYPIVKGEMCKFIWRMYVHSKSDNTEVHNQIHCFDVPLRDIQEVYRQFCRLVPDQYWPTMIEKLE